jgi:hypothetical protein
MIFLQQDCPISASTARRIYTASIDANLFQVAHACGTPSGNTNIFGKRMDIKKLEYNYKGFTIETTNYIFRCAEQIEFICTTLH